MTGHGRTTTRTMPLALALAAVLASMMLEKAHAEVPNNDRQGPETYPIAMFGDMPYNALGRSQYPALLADINACNRVETAIEPWIAQRQTMAPVISTTR